MKLEDKLLLVFREEESLLVTRDVGGGDRLV